jgi:hypothetical protein
MLTDCMKESVVVGSNKMGRRTSRWSWRRRRRIRRRAR